MPELHIHYLGRGRTHPWQMCIQYVRYRAVDLVIKPPDIADNTTDTYIISADKPYLRSTVAPT
ncbi:MAG: hypothetical protein QF503_10840, partial [Rhodospirillales bacterium]|nr:hypothetical protein [Rhodospirillales bacterium]